MTEQKKRPPIDIEELERREESRERASGELTYITERKPPVGGRFSVQGMGTKLLVTALAAVIISVFCTIQLTPSKVQYNEVVSGHNNLANQVLAIPATVAAVGARIDTVINSLASYATKGELSNLASSASVTALSLQIGSIPTDMVTLKGEMDILRDNLATAEGKLTAIDSAMAVLEARIEDLETRPVGSSGGTGSSEITVQVKRLGEALVPSADDKSITAQVKIILTNPTNEDATDVIMTLFFATELLPQGSTSSVMSLSSSPPINWISSGWGSDMEFRNGWGLTIDANKSRTVYTELRFTNVDPIYTSSYGYGYGIDVEVD